MKVSEISKFGAGLNIEGGFPKRDLPSGAKWVNPTLVLDRPLVDHINFDEIVRTNPFPLLENAIPEINERQMLATYLIMLNYYISNACELTNKENPVIVIHLHQDENCKPLIQILQEFMNELNLLKGNITFETDKPNYQAMNHGKYECDILISLSQCAGLDPNVPAGSIIYADTFIPFDLVSHTVRLDQTYTVRNEFVYDIDKILGQGNVVQDIVNLVNSKYKSANPKKELMMAKVPVGSDFIRTSIVQVDRLWNPESPDQEIRVIE